MLESLSNNVAGLKLYQTEIPPPVFHIEYFEIFKNTFFGKHLEKVALCLYL